MTVPKEIESFFDIFEQLEDPRVDRTKRHPLAEILLATVSGVAAGCDGWADIELFTQQRLDFLRQYQPFKNGAPSDDTLRRFFRAIDPEQFQALFAQWMKTSMPTKGASDVLAIDGKTLRGSVDGACNALHLISAYASEARLVLAQQTVAEKTNEITAIPELLKVLDLSGSTVTIDAMGCQYKIAQQITQANANYVLGLKGNQGHLHEDVVTWFSTPLKHSDSQAVYEEVDKGHGRIETRKISVSRDLSWLHQRHPKWKSIGCLIQVESERLIGETRSQEKRYYIGSSRTDSAECLLKAIRSHWGIENGLHWVLDMSFGEDQSRIRKGHAPGNIAVIRHAVLNAIQSIKPKRTSVKQMRKLAGWDNGALANILKAMI